MLQPQIELVVRLTPNGQIQLAGPLEHRLLCYGLLEAAKDAIRAMENQPRIVPAAPIPIQFPKPPGHD